VRYGLAFGEAAHQVLVVHRRPGRTGVDVRKIAPHHPLAYFLDQKAFALVVVEVKFLDRDGLGCCAVGGIDAPEASETLAKNGRAPHPQRGLGRVVLAPHDRNLTFRRPESTRYRRRDFPSDAATR
jgi:hypothetical protein